jgi:hypothetical protein
VGVHAGPEKRDTATGQDGAKAKTTRSRRLRETECVNSEDDIERLTGCGVVADRALGVRQVLPVIVSGGRQVGEMVSCIEIRYDPMFVVLLNKHSLFNGRFIGHDSAVEKKNEK